VEADLLSLAFDVRTRTVDRDGTVPLDGVKYLTPQRTPKEGVYVEPGDKVRVMESARGGRVKGRLVEKAHADAFALEPFEPARRGDYAGGPKKTMQEKLRGQVDLSQSIGHVLHSDRQGTRDLYDELSGGTLERPDVLPRPRVLRPDPESPFANGPEGGPARPGEDASVGGTPPEIDAEPEPDVLPEQEARKYVARRLRPHGLTYAGAADLFDELVEAGATRPQLDERLAVLENEIAAEKAPAQ
jgi:hypothetical protein